MLVVFGGLPGTGKTMIAREVARRTDSLYLRIDTIEQSIRNTEVLPGEIGVMGYAVAMALARENLVVGQTVVADAVNPMPEARQGWRDIAARVPAPLIEIEIICSDAQEHRYRVESRTSDVAGLIPPTWDQILTRHYVPWHEDHWVIDTARSSAAAAVAAICDRMRQVRSHSI
jgi:predicted kinase